MDTKILKTPLKEMELVYFDHILPDFGYINDAVYKIIDLDNIAIVAMYYYYLNKTELIFEGRPVQISHCIKRLSYPLDPNGYCIVGLIPSANGWLENGF